MNDKKLSGIEKYRTLSNKEFLTLVYMDDGNFVTQSISALLNTFHYIEKYKFAAGLEVNMNKTIGKFYNKKREINTNLLPAIKWDQKINVVGVNHTPKQWVNEQWQEVLTMFKKEVQYFKSFSPTFQAQAIISKSKLLSKLTYICSINVMPLAFRNSINKALLSFLVPCVSRNLTDLQIEAQIMNFAGPKFLGGYGVDHITIHADLFLLKSVMKYIKHKLNCVPLTNDLYFVEYHIGLQLSRHFGLERNNHTPHAGHPSEVYGHIFQLIRKYNITTEELEEGSISKIYKRIILQANKRSSNFKYSRIICKMLPSYLCSFNYKVHYNLLPVKTKFRAYSLDNDTCCYFCLVGPESIHHIFGTCEKLKVLWKIATETVSCITPYHFDFYNFRRNLCLDLVPIHLPNNNHNFERLLIYFNTVLSYSIWKERNEIKYNLIESSVYLIQFNQCVPVLNICVAFQLTLVYVDDFYFQMTRPFSTLGKLRHFHFVTTLGCLWIECEHLRCVMRLVHLVLWKTLVYGLFNRDWKQKGSVDTLVFSVSDKIQPDCSH